MQAIQIAPAKAPADSQTTSNTLPPHRILVVEDDGDIRRLNTEALLRSGYRVDAAVDGDAGWEALQAGSYDLLITDNSMPKLTGLELLKKLRTARVFLPVIMATGAPPVHEFAESPWLVPDATLVKPYTIPELLATVRTVLRATESDRKAIKPEPIGPGEPPATGAWQAFQLSILDWNEIDAEIKHRGNPP
jgi:DNA-binding response OmpR family regulator